MNFGKIYLLASPSLIENIPDLQKEMLSFHNGWNDQQEKYHYLNYFKFKIRESSDKKVMHVSDAFHDFFKTIEIK